MYVYLSAEIIVSCALQYVYNFHLLRLESLQKMQNSLGDNQTSTKNAVIDLEEQVGSDRSHLKLLGAPSVNLNILIECIHVVSFLLAFALYAQPQLYQPLERSPSIRA